MSGYTYEMVEHIKEAPMKCFIAGVDQSCPHWHEDIELVFLLGGSLTAVYEGETITMKPGDIVLFNSGFIHSDYSPEKDSIALIIQIQPALLQAEYGKSMRFVFHLNTADVNQAPIKELGELRRILASLGLELFMKNDGFQFYIRSRLYELIGFLFRNVRYDVLRGAAQEEKKADLAKLSGIVSYINEHHTHEISLPKAASDLNMSVSSLCRFFKEKMSVSFADYLQNIRVQHAKELLLQTPMNVLDISEECGFSSLASFYRGFKRVAGTTPTEFRGNDQPRHGKTDQNIQGYTIVDPTFGYELLSDYLK